MSIFHRIERWASLNWSTYALMCIMLYCFGMALKSNKYEQCAKLCKNYAPVMQAGQCYCDKNSLNPKSLEDK